MRPLTIEATEWTRNPYTYDYGFQRYTWVDTITVTSGAAFGFSDPSHVVAVVYDERGKSGYMRMGTFKVLTDQELNNAAQDRDDSESD